MTLEDWQESADTVQEYTQKLQKISDIMKRYFESSTGKIEQKLRQGDSLKFREIRGQNKNTALSLRLKKNIDFYALSPSQLREIITAIRERIRELSNSEAVRDVRNELRAIEKGLDFIDLTLCAKEKNMHVRGTKTVESVRYRTVGADRYAEEKELLSSISHALNFLYSYDKPYDDHFIWQLTGELASLQNDLDQHKLDINKTNTLIKEIFTAAFKYAGLLLLMALFISFLIMVFADYLKAHFDSSDTLRKVYMKGMTLLALFLLTGCGPDVESILETQKMELQTAAVEHIFSQVVLDEDNVGAVLYGAAGKEIILIKENGKQHSKMAKYPILNFYRAYNVLGMKMQYNPDSVKFNPIKKHSKKPYTHRTNMTISGRRMTFAQGNIPGLTVNVLVPENFDDWNTNKQEQWLQNHYDRMPSGREDHAIAFTRMEYRDVEPFVQNIEVLFNGETKLWEVKSASDNTTLKERGEVPQRDLQQEKNILRESGFRPITSTVLNPHVDLVLAQADYEIVENYNKGLVLVDGQWKEKIVHEQNCAIRLALSTLRYKRSWEAIENLSATIVASPKAENLQEALNRLENILREQIQKCSRNKSDLKFLLEKLDQRSLAALSANTRDDLTQKCRELIKKLDDEELARSEADKATRRERLTRKRENMEKIKECLQNDFKAIETLGHESGLFDDRKCRQQYHMLAILIELNKNNRRVISALIRDQWQLGDYNFLIICKSCNGKGKNPCGYCKNSGICKKCNGQGQYDKTETSLNGGNFHTYSRTISCSRHCTYCDGQRQPCKRCHGATGFLNKKLVKEALEQETTRFIEMVDAAIQEINREYEKVKE